MEMNDYEHSTQGSIDKGFVRAIEMYTSKDDAEVAAIAWRKASGTPVTARRFNRDVRCDGLRINTHVVVVRNKYHNS